jgi:conjugal transfer pilus assembly protein TrbC
MLASPLQKVDPELEAWVQSTSVRTDPDAVNWIKEHLKTDPHILASKNSSSIDLSGFGKTKCTNNTVADDIDSPIYVLISFSVPTESWVNLSKEMEKVGGVFVLRGLPENSFKALSQKILLLNDLGVTIPIQINPKLFGEFDVKVVPTIIVRDGDKYDKISGNVSLSYALETIQKEAL